MDDNKDAVEQENVEIKLDTVPGAEAEALPATVTIEERIAKVLDPNVSTEDRLANAATVLQFLKEHDKAEH
jgi:hypothetical protein